MHTFFQQPRTIGTWKLEVSDRTEFFNNIDPKLTFPKLTLECALVSLAELIDDLEFAVRKPLALLAFPTAVN